MFYNACLMLSFILIPRREIQRIFSPISHEETPAPTPPKNVALLSAGATFFSLFIYIPLVIQLEQTVSNTDRVQQGRKLDSYFFTRAEEIGGFLYREGTRQKRGNEMLAFAATRESYRTQLIQESEIAFAKMEAGIDSYLDWYYSLSGEYSRIKSMAFGELEEHMENELKEHLTKDDHFQALSHYLKEAADSDPVAIAAYKERIQSILNENRLDASRFEVIVVSREDQHSIYALPDSFDVTDVQQRFGASSAAGGITAIVAGKVLAKSAAKGVMKLGAKALIKVAVTKAAGTAGGATAGAAAGAAVGSIIPGVGTAIGAAIGGIVGGIATGVAVDKGILEIEEALSRQHHKTELTTAVSAAKDEFLALLQGSR